MKMKKKIKKNTRKPNKKITLVQTQFLQTWEKKVSTRNPCWSDECIAGLTNHLWWPKVPSPQSLDNDKQQELNQWLATHNHHSHHAKYLHPRHSWAIRWSIVVPCNQERARSRLVENCSWPPCNFAGNESKK